MQDSRNPKITPSRIILVTAGLLIVLLGIAGFWATSRASSSFNAEIERIRAAGGPLTLEEMLPQPVSDEENGAPLFLAALEALAKAGPPPDRKDEEGTLICSVGPDLVDDGGDDGKDITIRVP